MPRYFRALTRTRSSAGTHSTASRTAWPWWMACGARPFSRIAQLGSVSIRDIEMATGQVAPVEGETVAVDETQLNALLAATSVKT